MQCILRRFPEWTVRVLAMVLICALPVAYILIFAGKFSDTNNAAVFAALGVSLALAVLTVFAIVPLALGYALAFFDIGGFRRKNGLSRITHLIDAMPPVAIALAVITSVVVAGGRPSFGWALSALIISCAPKACLMCVGAIQEIPERYLLAGISLGASRRISMMGVVLPMVRNRLIGVALTILMTAIDQLALLQLTLGFAPGLIPSKLMPLPSLLLFAGRDGDAGTAAFAALVLLIVGCGMGALARGIRRRDG